MPKLCCAVDCRNIAAPTIAVNTSVNVEDSGPPTAPFDSAWKTGQETILWLCYMIIYCRYCCVGRVHHLVSLFCDRWQKNGDARFRFFGALHGLYRSHLTPIVIPLLRASGLPSFLIWVFWGGRYGRYSYLCIVSSRSTLISRYYVPLLSRY